MDEVLQSSTLREYDERITCKLWVGRLVVDQRRFHAVAFTLPFTVFACMSIGL